MRNALNGAKTVPSYLVGPRASPWPAHRIRQGMRLEVLHEKLPTAVWIAKVLGSYFNKVVKCGVKLYSRRDNLLHRAELCLLPAVKLLLEHLYLYKVG